MSLASFALRSASLAIFSSSLPAPDQSGGGARGDGWLDCTAMIGDNGSAADAEGWDSGAIAGVATASAILQTAAFSCRVPLTLLLGTALPHLTQNPIL